MPPPATNAGARTNLTTAPGTIPSNSHPGSTKDAAYAAPKHPPIATDGSESRS